MSAYPFAIEFFSQLSASGVRCVCVCPGSRSTPLAIAAEREPELRVFTHVDERSAAFFALGLARATRRPVALVCTSGTAAANFLPAVVEAHHARVPLILLTADRPPELRDWGAGQTIDQLRLFGSATHWFAELAPPEQSDDALRFAQSLAARAVAESKGYSLRAAGPVHLNWPLREPLEPSSQHELPAPRRLRESIHVSVAEVRANADTIASLVELVRQHERGWIACGPIDLTSREVDAVSAFARASGWPIVADAASQLRRGPHVASTPVLGAADLWLRDADVVAAIAPDVVVRLGPTPVSKAHRLALEAHPPQHLVLNDPTGDWQDPSHRATHIVAANIAPLYEDWAAACPPRRDDDVWLRRLMALDEAARAGAERELADASLPLCEPRATRALCDALPEGALLYVSNSMPIRDLDAFLPASRRRLRVLSNRGANGIDGVTSSAVGAAASGERVVLLTGDLAFLHDLGGLLAATRDCLDITIVVIDNNGGGIFSFLPVANVVDHADFERLFRMPHDLDLAHAAAFFGARFERAHSLEQLHKALAACCVSQGLSIVQVPVGVDESVASFRSVLAAGARAARQVLGT